MKKLIRDTISTYLTIGGFFAIIKMFSAMAFFSAGPGALWNVGFGNFFLGLFFAMGGALLTAVTWPIIVVIALQHGFQAAWKLVFYLWY